jgi:hypothetical protein
VPVSGPLTAAVESSLLVAFLIDPHDQSENVVTRTPGWQGRLSHSFFVLDIPAKGISVEAEGIFLGSLHLVYAMATERWEVPDLEYIPFCHSTPTTSTPTRCGGQPNRGPFPAHSGSAAPHDPDGQRPHSGGPRTASGDTIPAVAAYDPATDVRPLGLAPSALGGDALKRPWRRRTHMKSRQQLRASSSVPPALGHTPGSDTGCSPAKGRMRSRLEDSRLGDTNAVRSANSPVHDNGKLNHDIG